MNTNIISNQKTSQKPFKGINRTRWLAVIFILAIATIFYVNNVLQIHSLLKDNQNLKREFVNLKNSNEILRSRLNSLESPDRIIKIASENLKMIKSGSSPQILEVKKTK